MTVFAGCAGAPSASPGGTETTGGSPTAPAAAGECPASDTPVELDYWSWGDGYADAAALWNSTHPEIQVTYSDIPVGNSGGYQKMFNAVKAGTAPDIGFLEFDNIAAFGSQDYLADVSQYVTADEMGDFVKPVMQQVSLGTDGVFLARVSIDVAVPDEIIEAASVDGAGGLRTFASIGLPLMGPGLLTIFLFQFVVIWNNFMLPLIMLNDSSLYPVTLGLYNWNGQFIQDPTLATSVLIGAFLSVVPVIVGFLLLQRFWSTGLAQGGVKS